MPSPNSSAARGLVRVEAAVGGFSAEDSFL